eukprot:4878157-Prymnesium_polylepis.2
MRQGFFVDINVDSLDGRQTHVMRDTDNEEVDVNRLSTKSDRLSRLSARLSGRASGAAARDSERCSTSGGDGAESVEEYALKTGILSFHADVGSLQYEAAAEAASFIAAAILPPAGGVPVARRGRGSQLDETETLTA